MLRYVEQSGLVEPDRSAAGYRLFGPEQLQRLRDNAVTENYLEAMSKPPDDYPSEELAGKAAASGPISARISWAASAPMPGTSISRRTAS